MKALISLVKLDLKLLVKYNLLSVSIFLSITYILIFRLFDVGNYHPLVSAIVFSDPAMLGFIFIGVMVLYEKGQHTLQALSVCPVKFENYIWSKAISLTILALPVCFGIVFSAHGFYFNYFAFILAVLFSSLLFSLLGFIGVARVQTFNQYIIIIPLFFAPAIIPLLDLFDLWFHPFFYLIPTQASLLLFKASFEPISFFEWIYSIGYLAIWLIAARYLSIRAYRKHLLIN
jgi:fluoroquinolone transport system permease protein